VNVQTPDPHLTLPHKLLHWASACPDAVALRQKDFGIWAPITWREYAQAAREAGLGLLDLGLASGATVAVISENRAQWVFTQLGCGMAGGVTAGLYPTSPAAEIEYLLAACDARVVVIEDQEQLDKVIAARARAPLLEHIVVIDPKGLRPYRVDGLLSFDALRERGRAGEAQHGAELQRRLSAQREGDTALMIFTSGSTGRPKAACLSYGNINAMTEGAQQVFRCDARDTLLSYLPLCHVAEQIFTLDLPLASGAVVHFSESLRTVQADLREVAPTVFLGVPRIWEKMHASIEIKLREAGGARRALVERALASVGDFADRPRAGWTAFQRLKYAFWWALVFRALCNFLGLRRCRRALSGAAPISPELLRMLRTLGLAITEGYGMTETAGLATVQASAASPLGSVGAPIAGLEARLAEDGELLLRGPTIFQGYYKNPQATAEAIDADGWLHTGDVARWVDGGAPDAPRELRIVDRKKDIMITAGGKNITPSEIENALKFSSYLKEVVVVADRRAFVSALIQIDADTVGKWAEEQGLAYTNFKSLAEHAAVRELVQREVDAVNARMPQVQQVRRFHLLTKELDHDDGEVTATMKLRRQSIAERYRDEIEALYG